MNRELQTIQKTLNGVYHDNTNNKGKLMQKAYLKLGKEFNETITELPVGYFKHILID